MVPIAAVTQTGNKIETRCEWVNGGTEAVSYGEKTLDDVLLVHALLPASHRARLVVGRSREGDDVRRRVIARCADRCERCPARPPHDR